MKNYSLHIKNQATLLSYTLNKKQLKSLNKMFNNLIKSGTCFNSALWMIYTSIQRYKYPYMQQLNNHAFIITGIARLSNYHLNKLHKQIKKSINAGACQTSALSQAYQTINNWNQQLQL